MDFSIFLSNLHLIMSNVKYVNLFFFLGMLLVLNCLVQNQLIFCRPASNRHKKHCKSFLCYKPLILLDLEVSANYRLLIFRTSIVYHFIKEFQRKLDMTVLWCGINFQGFFDKMFDTKYFLKIINL